MAVLHDCVSTLPAETVQSEPPLVATVVMAKVRVATPFGPQLSEHAPSAP